MGTRYLSICEVLLFVKYFCETTGQKLVDDPDATTGATYKRDEVDTATGASKHEEHVEKKQEETDTSSGASEY